MLQIIYFLNELTMNVSDVKNIRVIILTLNNNCNLNRGKKLYPADNV